MKFLFLEVDINNFISIWGAISGTLGTVIAGYAVWLTKRSQSSRVVFENVKFREIQRGNYGASIGFTVSVANIGFTPTVVTGFYLDLGKELNTKYGDKESKFGAGLLKFRHIVPMGTIINGEVIRRPMHNETIQVLPGAHVGPIHLERLVMYGSTDNGEFSAALNELIKGNNFSISIRTTGNRFTSFSGKSLHWEIAT